MKRRDAMNTLKVGLLVAVILALSSCGMSLGETSFGTTSYLVEHNRKLEIVRGARDEPEAVQHNARWVK
jgi:hypothetical protein